MKSHTKGGSKRRALFSLYYYIFLISEIIYIRLNYSFLSIRYYDYVILVMSFNCAILVPEVLWLCNFGLHDSMFHNCEIFVIRLPQLLQLNPLLHFIFNIKNLRSTSETNLTLSWVTYKSHKLLVLKMIQWQMELIVIIGIAEDQNCTILLELAGDQNRTIVILWLKSLNWNLENQNYTIVIFRRLKVQLSL